MILQGGFYLPMEEAFESGKLLMSDEVRRAGEALTRAWGDYPVNATLAVLSALVFAFSISNFYYIFPHLAKCFSRWRWNFTIEGSLRLSRTRDAFAFLSFIPFCLVASRYRLIDPELLGRLVPEGWRALGILAIMVSWTLLRILIHLVVETRTHNLNAFQTARKAERTYFTLLTLILLATAGIFYAFGAEDSTIRTALIVASIVTYIVFLINKGEIFASFCNPLTTFLYLCALEFLPTGMLVAACLCL